MQQASDDDRTVRGFTVEASSDGPALRIIIRGEIDIATHHQLQTRLQHALTLVQTNETATVQLQLSELDFCDARGAYHLLEFVRQVRQAGRDIMIQGVCGTVRKLIIVLGIQDEIQLA